MVDGQDLGDSFPAASDSLLVHLLPQNNHLRACWPMRQLPSGSNKSIIIFYPNPTICSNPFRSKITLYFKILFELLRQDDSPFLNGRWGPIDDPFKEHLIQESKKTNPHNFEHSL